MKFKFSIRKDVKLPNGKSPIYLTINCGGRIRVNLNEHVLPAHWDKANQRVRPADHDANGINAVIDSEREKLLALRREARQKDEDLTFELVFDRYKMAEARKDFIGFMLYQMNTPERKKILNKSTLKHHRVVYEKLKSISGGKISFKSVNYTFFEKFHAYLAGTGVNPTTIHNNFKIIKTYLNLARMKGISVDDSYEKYKIPKPQSRTVYLTVAEVHKLMNWYNRPAVPKDHKYTLQCFLFACTTGGLRDSDIRLINRHNIQGEFLVFMPEKTKRFNKTVSVNLNQWSYKYMNPFGNLFECVQTNQKMNRDLREIASFCGIKKPVTFHVARHTFGTNFIKAKGDVVQLKNFMGHEDIKTTMHYVHLAKQDEQSKSDMKLFSDYIIPKASALKDSISKIA